MAIFRDERKTVEIEMFADWIDGYSYDYSYDFYDVGLFPFVHEDDLGDIFLVNDVDYLIEQANAWEKGVDDSFRKVFIRLFVGGIQ